MVIKFFQYEKKINSTNDPVYDGVTGVNLTGKILNDCSIVTPVIELEYGSLNHAESYNYAYISDFNRFYFVTNVTFNNSKWIVSLQVDVLASFKATIMSNSQYVLRSTYNYNEYLVDDAYNTYINPNSRYTTQSISTIYQWNPHLQEWVEVDIYNKPYSSGYYVLGIYSNNVSGVTWYRMSASTFKDFIQAAMAYEPSDMIASNIPNGYAKAVFDCTQYIVSCYWYPYQVLNINTSGGQVRRIKLGGYEIDIGYSDTGVYPIDTSGVEEFRTGRLTPPTNPNASTYRYLEMSPYTEYGVWFPPFGFVPLDSTKLFTGGNTEIRCRFYVDVTTGQAIFRVELATLNNAIVAERTASIGIPIPISNMTLSDTGALLVGAVGLGEYLGKQIKSSTPKYVRNVVEGVESIARSAVNAAANSGIEALSTQATKLLTQPDNFDFKEAVLDATAIAFGQLNTTGSPGTNMAYNIGSPYLYCWFFSEVEHDDARFGRPCRKVLNIATFSNGGYIVCANASLPVHAQTDAYPTLTELNQILTYLNNGVFLASTK